MKETIGFNNFKAFGEKMQRFSKKPITLVYGANSVGKSTFLHRELYMQYVLETGTFDVNKTTMFGDEIDFGGFDRFVHKRDPMNKICLHFATGGFERQYDDSRWKQFYHYTKEMQEDLLDKIEALSEDECKMYVLNIPTLHNSWKDHVHDSPLEAELNRSFAFDTNNLDLELTKGTQFETYRDISGKIFNPLGIGKVKQYIKLAVPVINPYFLREASLLLNKTITIDDCKSYVQSMDIFESLKTLSLKELIENNKNINTEVVKNRVAIAKIFLKNNIKPEWLCLTRIPLIPLKNNTSYRMEKSNGLLKKIKMMGQETIQDEHYKNLVEEIYLVLFSQGYNDPIYKVATKLIWNSDYDERVDCWNLYDFSQREKLYKGISSYKELLLSKCKSIFKQNEARQSIDLDVYIGETNNKVDIGKIDLRLNHQKFASVVREDTKVTVKFFEKHERVLVELKKKERQLLRYEDIDIEKQLDGVADMDDREYKLHIEKNIDALKNGFTVELNQNKSLFDIVEDNYNIPKSLQDIFEAAKRLLYRQEKETHYIGPLREYPSREDAFMVNDEMSKNNIMVQLRNNSEVRDIVNQWFASNEKLRLPYEVIERKLIDIESLYENDEHFSKILELKDKKLIVEYMQKNIEGLKEITFIDKRTNTPVHNRDMGLGVTQILPIIITTNTAIDAQIVIEQPELHLHPALQCELADEFIRSYKENDNTFLIESHSEHMLLRIMKRMRHTAEGKIAPDDVLALTPDDVCLLYVDGDDEKTWVNELELDTDGTLLDPWPHGFFEEGYNERFE